MLSFEEYVKQRQQESFNTYVKKRQEEEQKTRQEIQKTVPTQNIQKTTSKVTLPMQTISTKTTTPKLPTVTLAKKEDVKNATQYIPNKGQLYKLTDGQVDDRGVKNVLEHGRDIAYTAQDAFYNTVRGADQLSENIKDKLEYIVADIAEKNGNSGYAERLRNIAKQNQSQEIFEPGQKKLSQYSYLGDKGRGVFQGVGQSMIQGATALLPGGQVIMPLTTYTSASGGAMTEALNEGASNEEAKMYSRISGLGETISEYLFGGISKIGNKLGIGRGIGDLDDKLANTLTKRIKSQLAKNLVQWGVKSSGEGVEEIISGSISALGKKLTYMKEEDIKKLIKDQNLLDSFIVGTLSAGISQAPGAFVATKVGQDYINLPTQQQIDTEQKYEKQQQEYWENKQKQAQDGTVLENTLKNIQNKTEGQQVTNYNNQVEAFIKNSYLSNQMKQNLLNEIQGIQIDEEGLSQIREIVNTISKLDTNSTYKTDNTRKQRYMKYKNDNSNYDTQALNLALDSVKENRNGKRTVKQWLEVADKLGSQLVEKNNEEIEQIAYRSWFDLQPNTKDAITRYDNQTKTNQSFQKFTSDDWVNTIYDSVNKARENIDNVQNINKNQEDTNLLEEDNTTQTNTALDEGQYAKVLNNENSNTKVLYHGTNNNIENQYNTESGRKSNNTYGEATYLTTKEDYAKQYGNNILRNTINPNANIIDINTNIDNSNFNRDKIIKILKNNGIEAEKQNDYIMTRDYGIIDNNQAPYKKLMQILRKNNPNAIKDVMQSLGIDGIVNNETGTYAIYNQNVIENVKDNKNKQNDLTIEKYNNAIIKFKEAKGVIDRQTIMDISDNIKIPIKENSKYVYDSEMSKKAGNNLKPNITNIDIIFEDATKNNTFNFRKKAIENALNLFRDKKVQIKDTKTFAEINKSGIKETYSKDIGIEKLQSSNNFDSIIKEGIYKYTTKNNSEKNILYHTFFSPVSFNGENNIMQVVIKEFADIADANDKFYYHTIKFVDKINNEGNNSILPGVSVSKKQELLPSITNIIPQNNQNMQVQEKTMQDVVKMIDSKKTTLKETRKKLIEEMNITAEDLELGNDIAAINYQITDPVRINEKVFGRELGQKINDVTINKTKHNTAEKTRWLNQQRSEISDLGIKARSKESAAVQKYGEKQYVDSQGNKFEYGDKELALEFPDVEIQNKIKNAANVLRNKYDSYIDQINEVITSIGYDAIPKRKDYMRHFQELGDVFSKTGVPFNLNDMKAEDLPTDINGLTEMNKPGRNWFASAQKRFGEKTTYDAITGIDGYLEGAGNLIFHTQDIQNYRALSSLVRDTFGQTKGFDNLDNLTDEQVAKRIKEIQDNKLSKYAAWLDEQANSLAGKKGAIDRGTERILGRRGYQVLQLAKKQVGSNMTGLNVRSALTNFIAVTQAGAKTDKIALVKGIVSTINNTFNKDDFIYKSDFLTNRFGSDMLSQKAWQKVSNAGQILMTASDYVSANIITRSKYFEGLQKGMTESQAMEYANDFASRIMGDRSQGATPEIFNSKTLGLVTQFQLEVNNQWQSMIHDSKMEFQQNSTESGKAKAVATLFFQMGQLAVYSHLIDEVFEKLTGSSAVFDPIDIIKKIFGLDEEDDDKEISERLEEAKDMILDQIPFANLISGGGRFPIASALPIKELVSKKDQYGNEKSRLETLKEAAPYWILPTGYGQAKKTVQGIKTLVKGGDYKTNSKGEEVLRFPVENANVEDYIKAGLFGKYALPLSKEYTNNNYKTLSAKQTKTYNEANLPYKQYLDYLAQDFKSDDEETKTIKKINYINSQNWTTEQKYGIYKGELISDTERKDGTSQVTDAENMIKDGMTKQEYINMYNDAKWGGLDLISYKDYQQLKKIGLSVDKYYDYLVDVQSETYFQRKAGDIKEDAGITDKSKIKIIQNSARYNNKEKTAIYENYILDKSDKIRTYDVMKAMNININKILNYAQQDFESDKIDNGTLNGKSVSKTDSGSKANKVKSYLNNMGLTENQYLTLYGLNGYTLSSSDKTKVFNYVKSLDLNKQQKLETFNKMGSNFTVYKNGNITWK